MSDTEQKDAEPETVELPAIAPEVTPQAGGLPLVRVELSGSQINVAQSPDGSGDRAIIVGPVLLQIILPLDAEGARAVARELTGGIEIAGSLPSVEAAGRIKRR